MAQRVEITGPQSKQIALMPFLYANNTSVGKGADNKRLADIQLVQLFLNAFYKAAPVLFKKLPKVNGRIVSEVLMDGIVGEQTKAGITLFQQTIKANAGKIVVDGVVSVPRGGLTIGVTSNVFTIVELNNFFFSEPGNDKFNANLEDHPVVKGLPELAADLKRARVAA